MHYKNFKFILVKSVEISVFLFANKIACQKVSYTGGKMVRISLIVILFISALQSLYAADRLENLDSPPLDHRLAEHPNPLHIQELAPEIIQHICLFLQPLEAVNASLVCNAWRQIVWNDRYWGLAHTGQFDYSLNHVNEKGMPLNIAAIYPYHRAFWSTLNFINFKDCPKAHWHDLLSHLMRCLRQGNVKDGVTPLSEGVLPPVQLILDNNHIGHDRLLNLVPLFNKLDKIEMLSLRNNNVDSASLIDFINALDKVDIHKLDLSFNLIKSFRGQGIRDALIAYAKNTDKGITREIYITKQCLHLPVSASKLPGRRNSGEAHPRRYEHVVNLDCQYFTKKQLKELKRNGLTVFQ